MTAADRLRLAVEALPAGASVTLPREQLLAALEPVPAGDLTVPEVAERVGRSPSTVRSWLERGELRGYRFRGREWRVPPSALAEFLERERDRAADRGRPTGRVVADLGAWRAEVGT